MANEIYNTSWWGTALDTARTAGTNPDFFGSQFKLLTSEQDNLVRNGNFATDSDWTLGSGWSYGDGKVTKSGTDLSYLTQSSLTSVVGKTYRVKASITNVTTGNVRIDNFTSGTVYTSDTEVDVTFTATTANVFRFLGWNGFDGSIDNVSVIEVTEEDASYADMCMQTGSSTYECVNIVRNTY